MHTSTVDAVEVEVKYGLKSHQSRMTQSTVQSTQGRQGPSD